MQGELFPLPTITKVVIADFDGVFFTHRAFFAVDNPNKHKVMLNRSFSLPDAQCIQILNSLCAEPDTALVVISDCKVQGKAYCEDALRNSGYTGLIHLDWQAEDAPPVKIGAAKLSMTGWDAIPRSNDTSFWTTTSTFIIPTK